MIPFKIFSAVGSDYGIIDLISLNFNLVSRVKLGVYAVLEVMMKKTLIAQLQDGQQYLKLWPKAPELGAILPENRIVAATKMGIKVVPFIAVLSVLVQGISLGAEYLPQAITFALFLLSMPVQGLYWLGKRSNTYLPPSQASWFREIHSKMCENGHQPTVSQSRPRYAELAILLNEVYSKMDKAFRRELF